MCRGGRRSMFGRLLASSRVANYVSHNKCIQMEGWAKGPVRGYLVSLCFIYSNSTLIMWTKCSRVEACDRCIAPSRDRLVSPF